MKKFEIFYVKYIIKSKIFFLGFIVSFLAVFLIGTMTIRVSVVESCVGELDSDGLYMECEDIENMEDIHIDRLYIYQNRNEKMYQAKVKEIHERQDGVYLEIDENFEGEIEGKVSVDIVCGEQSLLKRIFVKAGRAE